MSDLSYIVRVSITTISLLTVMIVGTLLAGLFNPVVDNKQIFDVLGPMAHEIVGSLMTLAGGISAYYLTRPKDTAEGKTQ